MKKINGTFLVFMSAALFSMGGLFVKIIPWPALPLNGIRCLISVCVLAIYMAASHHKLKITKSVLIGAVCSFGTNILYTLANKMTTAANTIVLQFTAPVFIIFFMWLFFKERPKRLDVSACVCVFIGIVFFFVDSLSAGNMTGNMLALISGVTYAGVFMMNRLPGGDPLSSIILGHGLGAITGLPSAITGGYELNTSIAVCLLVLGVFQMAVAYICLCEGLRDTPPVTASLVSGIEPILNPVLVAVFYHETIGTVSLIGAVIVICSIVVYNVLKEKQGCVSDTAEAAKI